MQGRIGTFKKQATRGVERQEKNTQQDRAWVIRVLWLVIVIALCSVAWFFIKSPAYFPLKSIQIDGEYSHVSREELESVVLPNIQTGFFNLDLTQLHTDLLRMPWVRDVSIRRIWPSTLVVEISEHEPIAFWGESSFLTQDAMVFTPKHRENVKNLPFFIGPHGQQGIMLKEYATMLEQLQSLQLKILKIELTPRHAWSIIFNNGMEVMFGREQIQKRLNRFVQAYPKLFSGRESQIGYVDLRYTNGFAVHWLDGERA